MVNIYPEHNSMFEHNTVLLFTGSWQFPALAQPSRWFDEVTLGGLITALF